MLVNKIAQHVNATRATKVCDIQSLWSGYGAISRYQIEGRSFDSLIVKHVQLPENSSHPRGWNTDRSHQRKIHSYQVESHWYTHFASQCDTHCRVPECYATETHNDEFLIIMEDLDQQGFSVRKETATLKDIKLCLSWLAYFHACFMGVAAEGLWETGTYWHLATRPDELEKLTDNPLKQAALKIDQKLNESPYMTIVHGDAKLANFCFSEDLQHVAAVDFQYVGGGCGMKDVAYFIGSCLKESDCEKHEKALLDYYFTKLNHALSEYQSKIEFKALEQSWRPLYNYAWADFHRFIKGWSPGHWKIHDYSEKISQKVINELSMVSDT